MNNLPGIISHSGVKGMKWGIRRKKTTTPGHPEHEDYDSLKGRNPRTLSNAELKRLVNRGNLLKQHKEVTEREKSFGKKALEKVLSAMGNNATNVFATALVGVGAAAVGVLLKDKLPFPIPGITK